MGKPLFTSINTLLQSPVPPASVSEELLDSFLHSGLKKLILSGSVSPPWRLNVWMRSEAKQPRALPVSPIAPRFPPVIFPHERSVYSRSNFPPSSRAFAAELVMLFNSAPHQPSAAPRLLKNRLFIISADFWQKLVVSGSLPSDLKSFLSPDLKKPALGQADLTLELKFHHCMMNCLHAINWHTSNNHAL